MEIQRHAAEGLTFCQRCVLFLCQEIAQIIEECRLFTLSAFSRIRVQWNDSWVGYLGSLQVSMTFMDFRHDAVDIREEVFSDPGRWIWRKGFIQTAISSIGIYRDV